MSETSSIGREREAIQIAAGFEISLAFPQLCQLLGYRQRVAQDILACRDIETLETLLSLFKHTSEKIKQIIALN